jgi:hypothetical protein
MKDLINGTWGPNNWSIYFHFECLRQRVQRPNNIVTCISSATQRLGKHGLKAGIAAEVNLLNTCFRGNEY